jgi:hypothetical protein
MTSSFAGAAQEATDQGARVKRCTHCGGWTWVWPEDLNEEEVYSCERRECEAKEAERRRSSSGGSVRTEPAP